MKNFKRCTILEDLPATTSDSTASSCLSNLLTADDRTQMLQALRFYAEQASYTGSWCVGNKRHVMEDKGQVARNALKNIGS